jgi:hypothetical protein
MTDVLVCIAYEDYQSYTLRRTGASLLGTTPCFASTSQGSWTTMEVVRSSTLATHVGIWTLKDKSIFVHYCITLKYRKM